MREATAQVISPGIGRLRDANREVPPCTFEIAREGLAKARAWMLQNRPDIISFLEPRTYAAGADPEDHRKMWDTLMAPRTADGKGREVLRELVDAVEEIAPWTAESWGNGPSETAIPQMGNAARLVDAMVAARLLLGALAEGRLEAKPERPPRTTPLHAAQGPDVPERQR